MRKAAAISAIVGLLMPVASFAAQPVRPSVSVPVAGAPLGGAVVNRVGAPENVQSNLAGGSFILIGVLAAAAVGAGVYAGVSHHHDHPVSPG